MEVDHYLLLRGYQDENLSYRKQSLKKCVEITNFGIYHGQLDRGSSESKEDCENATYWKEKHPDKNVFVSYSYSLSACYFDQDRHVTLVSNPNSTVKIFSSCDQIGDSTLFGKNNGVLPGKEDQLQKEDNYQRNQIIYISSGVLGVIILILVVNVVLIRKIKKKNITIVDENAIYGRNEPNLYYEDGINTQIEDKNAYYG